MSSLPSSGTGRETRLLLLVIVVAVVMLLVLARFRYPESERPASGPVVAGPIERLAARATFEELALIVADLSSRVQPALVVVPVERTTEPEARRLITGLRIDADLAVVVLPAGFAIVEADGIEVAVVDEERGIALVRLALRTPFSGAWPVAPGIGGPGYVAAAEGGRGGPSLRPVFIGRADSYDDPRWSQPLLAIGGEPQVRAGIMLCTLDGRLIGVVVDVDDGLAIVRVQALLEAVEALRTR